MLSGRLITEPPAGEHFAYWVDPEDNDYKPLSPALSHPVTV